LNEKSAKNDSKKEKNTPKFYFIYEKKIKYLG